MPARTWGTRICGRGALWAVLACYLVLAINFASSIDPPIGLVTRVIWGLGGATIPTSVAALFLAGLLYFRALRGGKVMLYDGAVFETGFGESEMVSRGPLRATRLRYEAISSVTQRGDFVFMRQRGHAIVSVYPRELFPDEAVQRIRQACR